MDEGFQAAWYIRYDRTSFNYDDCCRRVYKVSGKRGTVPDNAEWKRGLQTQNESYKKQLEEMGETVPRDMKEQYQREIALNEYRILHDISPNEEYSVWGFVSDTSQLIEFAGLFTIIIAGELWQVSLAGEPSNSF